MYTVLMERLNKQPSLHKKISAYPNKIEDIQSVLKIDVAYASSVFSHLTYDERLSLMKSLRRHLKPSGVFVFNLVRQLANRSDKSVTLIGEKTIGNVTYRHFDHSQQMGMDRRKVTWRFEVESKTIGLKVYEEEFILNLDNEETIRVLLAGAGFKTVTEYGSWRKDRVDPNQPGLILVTQLA